MPSPARNIVLIGMPGVGKSTIGVLLAKALNRNFVDTDLVVQSAQGQNLQEIVDIHGKDGFQAIEEQHILTINIPGAVIATGGSAVYSGKAMAHLKQNAVTVYLTLPLEKLQDRIHNTRTRGLARNQDQSLADLHEERLPLYEQYADVTMGTDNHNHDEVVQDIIDALPHD